MKKKYTKPQMECHTVSATSILNGSSTGDGYTGEQNARSVNIFDPYGAFDEEEENQ